jgi:KRAB domain-containing zinc finger protein
LVLVFNAYYCYDCGKQYKYSHSLSRHKKYECGKAPKFECIVDGCNYKSKRKDNLNAHIRTLHLKELNVTIS